MGSSWGRVALLGLFLAPSVPLLESCGTASGDEMSGGNAGMNGDGSGGASSSGDGGSSSGDGGGIGSGVGGGLLGQGGGGPGSETECNDGVDNDDDGHIDAAFDPGCYGPADATEASGTRAEENGFTTFEFGENSVVVYVSAEGDDAEDGATPGTAVRTLGRADELVRDGEHDFMLLRRGDTWRDETLGRFKSGRDATHPIVIGSYGESLELPRLEVAENFIDHNGQARSFVALLDLHLINYAKDPTDPAFDGTTDSVLRYIGSGSNLLIEGCHFEYVELSIATSEGLPAYTGVEVRASVLEKAYHADTCLAGEPDGNDAFRPSGIYSSHVDGLLIEGNLLDHNGWNEDVDSACATIYNHNAYLSGNDIVIRDNVFTRASSIHIKMRSNATGDVTGTRISGNYFIEGEVGISIGGNSEDPDRFVDSEITGNVFSDVGRSQPTTRTLGWGIDVIDNDGLLIESNHFLNQWAAGVNNSYAIRISDGSARDVDISGNLFYRIKNRSIVADGVATHEAISVSGNTFVDPDQDSRLVVQGSFIGYTYADNSYYSSANPDAWFGTDTGNVGVDGWMATSGETGAEQLATVPDYVDPQRTIETYAESLEIGNSLEAYLGQARLQSRLRYYYELSAPAINDYIRAGFED
jgi:hypothetical protein